MSNSNATTAAPEAPATNGKRRKALTVAAAVLLAGAAYGAYYALVLSHYESTDNAYVQGNLVQITPQVGGTVVGIGADDTDFVKAGQTLVKLDAADAQVALDQAEAQLAQTVREVRGLYANNSTLNAQIALRQADVQRAVSDLAKAQDDVNRRMPLVQTGAVGKEEFNHANAQLAASDTPPAAAASAMTGRANDNVQAAADNAAAPAAENQVVPPDQLNDLDRALQQDNPSTQKAVIAAADAQPRPAPVMASSQPSSARDQSSLIGKIFIGVGTFLTLASAARMFMA